MIEVLGAGFGRTGTLSLRQALVQLGFSRCYHMLDVIERPADAGVWRAAANGAPTDWDTLFDGYRAAVDWPACHFWRELSEHYPAARVILTVRDPAAWYASAKATIYRAMTARADPERPSMSAELILHRTFAGRFEDEAHARAVFERHNAAVRAALPAERLLVYEVSEGWPPLCRFLGVPVPATPFPHANTTADFQRKLLVDPPATTDGD